MQVSLVSLFLLLTLCYPFLSKPSFILSLSSSSLAFGSAILWNPAWNTYFLKSKKSVMFSCEFGNNHSFQDLKTRILKRSISSCVLFLILRLSDSIQIYMKISAYQFLIPSVYFLHFCPSCFSPVFCTKGQTCPGEQTLKLHWISHLNVFRKKSHEMCTLV